MSFENGPGKYDDAATAARAITGGSVLLIVIDGKQGGGFSVQIEDPTLLEKIPDILETVARNIRMERVWREDREVRAKSERSHDR